MRVSDEAKARDYLDRIGYYRLSGYWFAFRERSGLCCPWPPRRGESDKRRKHDRIPLDHFKPGTRFEDAVALYVFDKKLRLLAMDALERIEIALRVDMSHLLGERDPVAYIRPDCFHESFGRTIDPATGLSRHHLWLGKQAALINRSREEFVLHHKARYGLPLPIWVACEVWDFGCMSTLFGGMEETDQDAIARRYGISNGRVFASWIRSLNYLRNVCAHHSRLWNRNIVDQPKLPPISEAPELAAFHGNQHLQARAFLLLCICQHLMNRINPMSSWGHRLKRLLDEEFPMLCPLGLNLAGMGVDEGWRLREW